MVSARLRQYYPGPVSPYQYQATAALLSHDSLRLLPLSETITKNLPTQVTIGGVRPVVDWDCYNVVRMTSVIIFMWTQLHTFECDSLPPTCAGCFRSVCVCLSLCLSVWLGYKLWSNCHKNSFLVWLYILVISRSGLSIKVIGSRPR